MKKEINKAVEDSEQESIPILRTMSAISPNKSVKSRKKSTES